LRNTSWSFQKAVRDWTNRNHKKHWESITGLTHAKGLILRPSARRTKGLLKLNRNQLRWVVRLPTGLCHLKEPLFKLGLTDDPICQRWLEEYESAISCVAHVIFRHLGQFFMKQSDYYDAPIYKVLHFIRVLGLIKGWIKKGKHNRSLNVAVQGLDFMANPLYIHTYIYTHITYTYIALWLLLGKSPY
jgi:hypothetical protein